MKSKWIWKRVNRWVAFGIVIGVGLPTVFLTFLIYSASRDIDKLPHETIGQQLSQHAWTPVLGLLIVIWLFMAFCVLESLFEAITGRRPIHPFMKYLAFNPNAHLARGETPVDLSEY